MAPIRTRPLLLLCTAALLLCQASCAWALFSSVPEADRSRPVALIETTGGIEYGATTEFGILTLGRSAYEGPCRVHYFLGSAPVIEDGEVEATGSSFFRARSDLRTQHLRVLDRAPTPDDELLAMWTADGRSTTEVAVQLAAADGVAGDVIADPGTELPAGAALFVRDDDGLRFCGLVAARAALQSGGGEQRYYVFAGVDRVRELLAVPERWQIDYKRRYRPDDITVLRPIR